MSAPTFAPGHDLVGRYRILELLGVGHTAEVYLADDLSLRRQVVVKVLLGSLSTHEDVRRAFRDRIVRSATLSHPHLERVYDGGQESGHIFMITEYLGGGSLEDVLGSGRRLSVDDVSRLGRDVASGLAYLHESGFVHGALSPHTLLFDDEGRVRVTDIALSGLGGMHGEQLTYDEVLYISPEQAQGEPAVAQSDVYALALILFEAATGSSPFESMTPEAMLRTRVNTPLPVRPELGTLDMLLAQAAVPDPRLRLSAEQFENRLGASVSTTAPLSVEPVQSAPPLLAQFNAPEPRTSIGFTPPSPDEVVGHTTSVPSVGGAYPPVRPKIGPANRFSIDSNGMLEEYEDEPLRPRRSNFEPSVARPPRRRQMAFVVAAVLILVVALGGGAAWKLGLFTQKHTVPSLTGLTTSQASQVLKGDGFTLSITSHQNSSNVPANEIISQNPAAGTSSKAGLVITAVISDGPVMVNVPANLLGEDCVTATAALLKINLSAQCPSSASVPSKTVPVGKVVKVLYHGALNPTSVPQGATLTLALSSGSGGQTTSATTTTLAPGGVVAPTTTVVAPTTTLKTTTTLKSTATTTTLKAVMVTMPNVVGMSRTQVNAAMSAAGLYYVTKGPNAGTSKWTTVVSQIPAPGTLVKKLSTVTLNVK